MPKTHAVKSDAGKWDLGRALCNCTISRYTPTSDDPAEVTCDRCRVALVRAYSDPCRRVFLSGEPTRRAIRGTARTRAGEGKLNGLYVVSAVTDRMRREDLDSSACVFLAQGLIEHINSSGLNEASGNPFSDLPSDDDNETFPTNEKRAAGGPRVRIPATKMPRD